MSYLSKLNKRLNERYDGRVHATVQNGCLHLSGELPDWQEIVRAGHMAVDKKRFIGLVNDIRLEGQQIPPMRLPDLSDDALEGARPDVLVIGGGVTGCAIARELMRYRIGVLLVEKEHDVAMHASGRNDGMVHPGIDLRKGQTKKKYNDLGNSMYDTVCAELGVPFRRIGQYLCFYKTWMKPVIRASQFYWKRMHIPVRYMSSKELLRHEPNLNDEIRCALHFPTAGIVCPYGLTIAYAENAVDNGARLSLDTAVLDMEVAEGRIISVLTNRGRVYPKLVINAAGVFSEEIAKLAQDHFYSIHPRKGTNMILDKKSAYMVKTIASPINSDKRKEAHTKGGGIVRTVDGNLLVGPNAVETCERENFETNRESIQKIIAKHKKTSPALSDRDIITYFTGVRAATYEEDFIVTFGKFTENIIHAAGIQSPGLTAAPAIAVEVAAIAARYLGAGRNDSFNPIRKPIARTAEMTVEERNDMIKRDPAYGVIICRCEEVSLGEIRDALHRSVPCDTVDGVKRRVRPGMGRCQGGFCGPQVAQIIAGELGIPLEQVRKAGCEGNLLLGSNKEAI